MNGDLLVRMDSGSGTWPKAFRRRWVVGGMAMLRQLRNSLRFADQPGTSLIRRHKAFAGTNPNARTDNFRLA